MTEQLTTPRRSLRPELPRDDTATPEDRPLERLEVPVIEAPPDVPPKAIERRPVHPLDEAAPTLLTTGGAGDSVVAFGPPLARARWTLTESATPAPRAPSSFRRGTASKRVTCPAPGWVVCKHRPARRPMVDERRGSVRNGAGTYSVRSWVVAGSVAATLACVPPHRSHPPENDRFLVIRARPDTVTLTRLEHGAGFYVTAIMRNEGGQPFLMQGECGRCAQRLIGQTWTTVWTPICVSGGDQPTTVAARDSLVVGVSVYGFTKPEYSPRLDPRLQPGLYRLVFLVGTYSDASGTRSDFRKRASQTFLVRDSVSR